MPACAGMTAFKSPPISFVEDFAVAPWLVPYRESLEQHGKEMENRKQETGNWKRVNLPVLHFRFSVSCFSFLPCLVPALPG
jgi:hypothetical protein